MRAFLISLLFLAGCGSTGARESFLYVAGTYDALYNASAQKYGHCIRGSEDSQDEDQCHAEKNNRGATLDAALPYLRLAKTAVITPGMLEGDTNLQKVKELLFYVNQELSGYVNPGEQAYVEWLE